MKRILIPPSVFYNAMMRHGPMAIDDFGLASRAHTIKMLLELRAVNHAHICGWQTGEMGRYRAVYAAGPGKDAPMPRMSIEEARERQYQKRRQKREASRPKPPVPVLPENTPVYGMWGI